MGRKESVVFGIRAALAVAHHRPESIVRVLYEEYRRKDVGPLLKAAAKARRPYREVETDDLNRQAKSVHHEGVVVVCEPKATIPFGRYLQSLPDGATIIALDNITNPHNQGAILRSLGWFGGSALLVNDPAINVNAAAMRISQGAGEFIPVVRTSDLPNALGHLTKAGIRVVAADQRAERRWSTGHRGGTCFVMGNEADGLSKAVADACPHRVQIPGTGAVESLNVSVAAGVFLALNGYATDSTPT